MKSLLYLIALGMMALAALLPIHEGVRLDAEPDQSPCPSCEGHGSDCYPCWSWDGERLHAYWICAYAKGSES